MRRGAFLPSAALIAAFCLGLGMAPRADAQPGPTEVRAPAPTDNLRGGAAAPLSGPDQDPAGRSSGNPSSTPDAYIGAQSGDQRNSNPARTVKPTPPVREAGPMPGFPWLTWSACLGALALLLAVAALSLAIVLQLWKSKMNQFARALPPGPDGVAARDLGEVVARMKRDMDARWSEVTDLKRQVADLQRSLDALRAASPRSDGMREPRASQPRYPVIPARPSSDAGRAPSQERQRPPASAARVDSSWRAGLLTRFREATLDPSDAGYRLMQDFRVLGATVSGSDYALSGEAESAKLWAVPIPGDSESFLLLPGYSAITNWSAHFSPHRQTAATDIFGGAFDLIEGGGAGLAVEAPAVASSDGRGGLSVTQRGRLLGFRS